MNKKAAVELSMNFLVIVILAVVIVGFSFYIFFTIFGKAEELSELTQERLNERVEALQCDGVVCMPSTYKKLPRGKSHLFGVKILNTGDDGEFTLDVNHLDEPTLNYAPRNPYPVFVKRNKEERVGIGVDVPKNASSGVYIFNVEVLDPAGAPYGPKQQIRIEVP